MTPPVTAGARRSTRAVLVATAALASPVVAEQQSDPLHQPERRPAASVACRAAPPIVRRLGGVNGESTDRRHQRDIELQSLGTTKSPNRAQVTR